LVRLDKERRFGSEGGKWRETVGNERGFGNVNLREFA